MKRVRSVVAVLAVLVAVFSVTFCASISKNPDKMSRAITVIQGLDRAITWIGPYACIAVHLKNDTAGVACDSMVEAAKTLQDVTDKTVDEYKKNPTPENAQKVLDLLDRMQLTWDKLNLEYKGKVN